jgi:hypothetical protein
METANLYEEGAVDCVKAFHMWQLSAPATGHLVPYDIWRVAWLTSQAYYEKEINKMSDQIDALCIDLEVKRGFMRGMT